MTRDDHPATRPATLRRWAATGAVLLIAAAAGLGNAPGPVLKLVRHESMGKFPPVLQPSGGHLRVALPKGRAWVALHYYRYGHSTPILRIRAKSAARPLPHHLRLSYGVPGIKPEDFDIFRGKGQDTKGLYSGSQKGWYAVMIEDITGQRSMVNFEAGQNVSRGYFSCSSKPRLVRHETHRKLAPPDVRSHFEGLFKAVPRLKLAPAPAPPAKKRTPVPPPQPPSKQPAVPPPAGK